MKKSNYHPNTYWSRVARDMEERTSGQLIAGDNEPYYDYKRQKFLKLLHSVDFKNKAVLEIGSGPGGNLIEVASRGPKSITGADISADMIRLATKNTEGTSAQLHHIDGENLPFADNQFDICFTATVLQHNSDEEMMANLLGEACRVTRETLVLFEKLDTKLVGDDLCVARPISLYESIVSKYGFSLSEVEHINIRVSYYVSGAIRKLFNKKGYQEGEKPSPLVPFLQKMTLPITKLLDPIFKSKKDVGKLVFKKKK